MTNELKIGSNPAERITAIAVGKRQGGVDGVLSDGYITFTLASGETVTVAVSQSVVNSLSSVLNSVHTAISQANASAPQLGVTRADI